MANNRRQQEKGLPANIDAEKFVLGSVLLDGDRFLDVAAAISADDFALEKHRRIFQRMCEIQARDERVDRVTVANELMRRNELESVDGLTYLVSLDDGLPHISNIDSYIRIIKDKSALRRIAMAAQYLMNRALLAEESPEDILAGAEETLLGIGENRADAGLVQGGEFLRNFPGGFNAFAEPSKRDHGMPTGFTKFDEMTGGLRKGELTILAARPSMGKAQPLSAAIQLRDGTSKPMGQMEIGDQIASVDGGPSEITGVFPQSIRPVYEIVFSDGRSTKACAEHLWEVFYRNWNPHRRVITTAELAEKLSKKRYVGRIWCRCFRGETGQADHSLPDAWMIGYLIGNGNLSGQMAKVTIPDQITYGRMRACVERYGSELRSESEDPKEITYRIARKKRNNKRSQVCEQLHSLGLMGLGCGQKFIPNAYFYTDRDTRLEMLRGLLDSDGTAEKSGAVTFSSSSKRLRDDVQRLVRSIGGACSAYARSPHFRYKGEIKEGVPAFMAGIILDDPREAFWLPRKKERAVRRSGRRPRLTIESVRPCGSAMTQCISVSHASGLYVTDEFVVTHNTAMALNMAWHVAARMCRTVAVFSLEMSMESLLLRVMCAAARVDSQRLRAGYLNPDERNKIRNARDAIISAPMYIDDTSQIGLLEIHSKLRRLNKKLPDDNKIALVVVDYLQLMARAGRENNNENQDLSRLSRGLKLMSKEMDCPFLVLSQLSRANEQRTGDKRPQLSDLRGSGSLEQDADNVGFVFRPEVYHRDRDDLRGMAELILAKQRQGPIGKIDLVFLHAQTRFENRAEDLGDVPQEELFT